MNKSAAVIALAFAVLNSAHAQSGAPKPASPVKSAKPPAGAAETKLPSQTEVEASLQRTLGYDPALSWTILEIRPSAIPGVSEVTVSLNKQAPTHMFLSPDGKTAIIGDMIPFGPNPFAAARAALQAADGPARSAQNPAILLVEFSDFQCTHCKAAQPVLEKLVTDFPRVRYVFQQFPLVGPAHPWSMKAAEYADCAGRMNNEAFWKYVDSIFENQSEISAAAVDDKLKELARAAGLDEQQVASCAAAPETEARVRKSVELGQSLDVTATPTVFMNGRRVTGVAGLPYDQLKNLVQFEINHAGK